MQQFENRQRRPLTLRSERRSSLKNGLTEPTLLEMSAKLVYQELFNLPALNAMPSKRESESICKSGQELHSLTCRSSAVP